jgi:hypothetical protein
VHRAVPTSLCLPARGAFRRRDRPAVPERGHRPRHQPRHPAVRPTVSLGGCGQRDPARVGLAGQRAGRVAPQPLLLPARPRARGQRDHRDGAAGPSIPWLGGSRGRPGQRRRHRADPPVRGGPGGRDANLPVPVRHRGRRRELLGPQPHGRHDDRPRVRVRLAHRRHDSARAAGPRRARLAVVQARATDHDHPRRGPASSAVGVHATPGGVARRAQLGGDGVASGRRVRADPGQRGPRTARGVQLPRALVRPVARRATVPRGRRRAPHATIRRPGHVCGPSRRREPGVEARHRAPGQGPRLPARHLRFGAHRTRPALHRPVRGPRPGHLRDRSGRGRRSRRPDESRIRTPRARSRAAAASAVGARPHRQPSAGRLPVLPGAGDRQWGERPVRRPPRPRLDGAGPTRRLRRAPGGDPGVGGGLRHTPRRGRRPTTRAPTRPGSTSWAPTRSSSARTSTCTTPAPPRTWTRCCGRCARRCSPTSWWADRCRCCRHAASPNASVA